ncbi:unnamed protein product, partial [Larinioides sclopetarius]
MDLNTRSVKICSNGEKSSKVRVFKIESSEKSECCKVKVN